MGAADPINIADLKPGDISDGPPGAIDIASFDPSQISDAPPPQAIPGALDISSLGAHEITDSPLITPAMRAAQSSAPKPLRDTSKPETSWLDTAKMTGQNILTGFKEAGGKFINMGAEQDLARIKAREAAGLKNAPGEASREDAAAQFGFDVYKGAELAIKANQPNVAPDTIKSRAAALGGALADLAPIVAAEAAGGPLAALGYITATAGPEHFQAALDEGQTTNSAALESGALTGLENLTMMLPLHVLGHNAGSYLEHMVNSGIAFAGQSSVTTAIEQAYSARKLSKKKDISFGDAWDQLGGWATVRDEAAKSAVVGGVLGGFHRAVKGDNISQAAREHMAADFHPDDALDTAALETLPTPGGATPRSAYYVPEKVTERDVMDVGPLPPVDPAVLTPEDHASPVPTDLIGTGKSFIDAAQQVPGIIPAGPKETTDAQAATGIEIQGSGDSPEAEGGKNVQGSNEAPAGADVNVGQGAGAGAVGAPEGPDVLGPIVRRDGKPWSNKDAAQLAADERADLKGQDLTPIELPDGGWGLTKRTEPATDAISSPVGAEAPPQPLSAAAAEPDIYNVSSGPEPTGRVRGAQIGKAIDRAKNPENTDVIRFLAAHGGIRDDEGHDLRNTLNNDLHPGVGNLITDKGMTLERAEELARENDYFDKQQDPDALHQSHPDFIGFLKDAQQKLRYRPQDQARIEAEKQATMTDPALQRAIEETKADAKERGLELTDEDTHAVTELMATHGIDASDALDLRLEKELTDRGEDARKDNETNHEPPPFEIERGESGAVGGEDRQRPENPEVEAGQGSARAPPNEVAPQQAEEPAAQAPVAPAPPAFGSTNKLVTTARADELAAKMRAKFGGQLNSGVDPELMAMGAELALYYAEGGARKFGAFAQAMSAKLGDWSKPYLRSWYEAVRYHPAINQEGFTPHAEIDAKTVEAHIEGEKAQDVSGSKPSLEQDRGGAAAPNAVGETRVPNGAGGNGPRAGGTEPAPAQPGNIAAGGERVPGDDAAPLGEGSVGQPREPTPNAVQRPAKRGGLDGGGADSGVGSQFGRIPKTTVDAATPGAPDLATQPTPAAAAATRGIAFGDKANIDATLPKLKPDQRDDVLKIEQRFNKPDGHGYLTTNGTGTGKTYIGAGEIARFVAAGKGEIMVVVPSDGIAKQWLTTLSDLGVHGNMLESTKDAGKGVNVTTYANFGANRGLADRKFDFVISDEAHRLMQNAAGDTTNNLEMFRAITNHPDGLMDRARYQLRAEGDPIQADLDRAGKFKSEELLGRLRDFETKVRARAAELAQEPRPKALMLSATPFAYVKNVDLGHGYLFDWHKGRPSDENRSRAYNEPDNRQNFYIQNFGYRMRYNRLTAPDAKVDTGVMEREFHERLKRDGSLGGRQLDVPFDYDRKFVTVSDGIGNQIDQALTFLAEADEGKFRPLHEIVNKRFNYLERVRLLEAIKAQHAIPIIKEHMALGRKVVVFHGFNEGGGFNPFEMAFADDQTTARKDGTLVPLNDLLAEFQSRNPYIAAMKWDELGSPIETLSAAFPNAVVYNGTVSKKVRAAGKEAFQTDGSKVNLMVVQADAGKEGLSLHDQTGAHMRVLINLGLPTAPTVALQQEGRVYRVGQQSDAAFRYLNTGTNWERHAFASKIAERISTVDNLAMGNQARALKQSFIDAFQDSSEYQPGADDGKGGKERDKAIGSQAASEWDRAKSYYYAQQKLRGTRDQRDGIDYYPTPEPVGLKMVQLANIKPGDRVLEPSAGHGAIARWFPEDANRTLIEPSSELSSKATLAAPGAKVIQDRFDNHSVVNKYDAIVMNPPFGVGGKTAMEHVAKAMTHLRNGGRIVALIPRGGQADGRFENLMDSDGARGVHIVANIDLPPSTFERAGTQINSRIVVLEKQTGDAEAKGLGSFARNHRDAPDISTLFNDIEHHEIPPRIEPAVKEAPVADEHGIVEAGEHEMKLTQSGSDGSTYARYFAEPTSKEVKGKDYDRLFAAAVRAAGGRKEGARAMSFPSKARRDAFLQHLATGKPAEGTTPVSERGPLDELQFTTAELKHGQTGADIFAATPNTRVPPDVYQAMAATAKRNGGYWSRYTGAGNVVGFHFPSEAQRTKFLEDVRPKFAEEPATDKVTVYDENNKPVQADHFVVPGAEKSDAQAAAQTAAEKAKQLELLRLKGQQSKLRASKPQKEAGGMFGGGEKPQGSLFAEERAPVATLRGDELAPKDAPFEQLRDAAGAWYKKNLFAKAEINRATGRKIIFGGAGFDHIIRAGSELLRVVPALREAVRDGLPIGEPVPDRSGRQNVKAWHNIGARVEVDGEPLDVVLKVREDNNGNFYYSLNRMMDEPARMAVNSSVPALTRARDTHLDGARGSALNIEPRADFDKAREKAPDTQRIQEDWTQIDTSADQERIDEARKQVADGSLVARLKEVGIDDRIALKVAEYIRAPSGRQVAGAYLNRVIYVALSSARGPRNILNHEIVHALRDMGLFKEPEWRMLEQTVLADKALMDDVRRRYAGKGLSERQILEEAIADHFARWEQTPDIAKGFVRVAFERLRDFFKGLKAAFSDAGYTNPEDLFRAMDSGRIGTRDDQREPLGEAAYAEERNQAAPVYQEQEGGDLRTPEMKNLSARIRGPMTVPTWQKVRQGIQAFKDGADIQTNIDRFHGIAELEKESFGDLRDAAVSAYKAARLTQGISTSMAHVLRYGPLELRDGWFQPVESHEFEGGFQGVFDPIKTNDEMELFKDWMIAQRASRLMGEGRERLLSESDIAQINGAVDANPERAGRFRGVFAKYQRFNSVMLDNLVATGRISQDQKDFYTQHADYVPFYRLMEPADDVAIQGASKGLKLNETFTKTLKGGRQQIGDPIENMVMNLTKIVSDAMKQETMNRVVDLAVDAEAMAPTRRPLRQWKADEIAAALRLHGIDISGLPAFEQQRWAKTLGSMIEPPGKSSVTHWVDGKAKHYDVYDPLLLRSISGMTPKQFTGVMKMFGAARHILTMGVTTQPAYMAANAVRDTLSTWAVSGQKGFNPMISAPKGLYESLVGGKSLMNLMAAGAEMGSFYNPRPKDVRSQIDNRLREPSFARTVMKTPKQLWGLYNKIGAAAEQANRISVYDHIIKNGGTNAEAAYQSLDLMDFNMGGDGQAARFLAYSLPFYNARVQGLYRLARGAVAGTPAQKFMGVNKQLLLTGSLIAAASLALYAKNRDDERYIALEDWEKDAYWNFWIGKDHYRIPKPMEVGALFGTLPERIARLAEGRDDMERFGDRMWDMVVNTFAVDLRTQLLKPLLEAYGNKNSFTGRQIETESDRGELPEARYDAYTSQTARLIGRKFPDWVGKASEGATGVNLKSPKIIDHLINGYLSGLGTSLTMASDMLARSMMDLPPAPAKSLADMPVVSRFFQGDKVKSSQFVEDFHDMYNNTQQLVHTLEKYVKEGEIERARTLLSDSVKNNPRLRAELAGKDSDGSDIHTRLEMTQKALGQISVATQAILESKALTGAQKREELDKLTTQRNLIAKLAVQRVKAAEAAARTERGQP